MSILCFFIQTRNFVQQYSVVRRQFCWQKCCEKCGSSEYLSFAPKGWWIFLQVSISSTLYAQIFRTNVFSAAFLRTYVRTYIEKSCRIDDIRRKNSYVKCWWNWWLVSISSTFYGRVFCKKFWCQKLQSCVLDLKLEKKLPKRLSYEKRWWNWPLGFLPKSHKADL